MLGKRLDANRRDAQNMERLIGMSMKGTRVSEQAIVIYETDLTEDFPNTLSAPERRIEAIANLIAHEDEARHSKHDG